MALLASIGLAFPELAQGSLSLSYSPKKSIGFCAFLKRSFGDFSGKMKARQICPNIAKKARGPAQVHPTGPQAHATRGRVTARVLPLILGESHHLAQDHNSVAYGYPTVAVYIRKW